MACRNAGVSPGQIQYVEAHGTGASVGDLVEVKALGDVLSEGRPDGDRCVIGSVKANIGHTEAAAGMAGLIKTILCLKRKLIPPSLHFREPNPNIPWRELPLTVLVEMMEWMSLNQPYSRFKSHWLNFGVRGEWRRTPSSDTVVERWPPPASPEL